ncbi:MAG TPA: DNA repair exonuclease [Methanothermobacter sp.]|nr:metallophosphoesterase [Methanothermobacter sp. MT-2]HHW04701.1 DNA repair exonuclease [Methanothermobacter sp.]HOK72821.1 DNA repair exonuclease [Methanothermobacter sp.]HOL69094.1 DNA repair exonuclease [Methanothermobacter sp.]HPQ04770.1 DNA repair exonuclease [Methanothermobacter sp.]
MYRFAHLADCHLGAHRYTELKRLEIESFERAIKRSIDSKVDFILISGDLFHSNIPNMEVVKEVAKILKGLKEAKIPVYVCYGSHDYSPTRTSMIDVFESAGLLKRVDKIRREEKGYTLDFTADPVTGAKLTGISARRMSMEIEQFRYLDRGPLEAEEGFKIFLFHSAITEFKPAHLSEVESIPLNLFPQGFDYYAGGHLHERIEKYEEDYGLIVYPGPLFGSYATDLEANANGKQRGFYIIEFDDTIQSTNFMPLDFVKYAYFEYDVTGKGSQEAMDDIISKLQVYDVEDKLVMVKILGELSSGKTADIDPLRIRNLLMEMGALHVNINRHGLKRRERRRIRVRFDQDASKIEESLFKENRENLDVLRECDVDVAKELLDVLKRDKEPNERRIDYEDGMFRDALRVLSLDKSLGDLL